MPEEVLHMGAGGGGGELHEPVMVDADFQVNPLEDQASGGNPCRFWVATIQVEADDVETQNIRLAWRPPACHGHPILRYFVGQRERGGQTGRLHWQCYIQLHRPCRARQVRQLLNCPWAWIKPARGSPQQCHAYCTKQESRVEGQEPVISGTMVTSQGKRNDLSGVYDMIKDGAKLPDIVREHSETYMRYHAGIDRVLSMESQERASGGFRDIEVIVVIGPPGSGKTKWVYDNYAFGDIYSLTLGGTKVWWDGYHGHKVVLIDDFAGNLPYRYLLRVTDRYPMQVEVKGGSVYLENTVVVFTSNLHWSDWYSKVEERKDIRALQRRISKVLIVSAYGVEPTVQLRGTPSTEPENWVPLPSSEPMAPGFVPPAPLDV